MIDHFPGPKKWPIFGNVLEWSFELGKDKIIYLKLVFQYSNCIRCNVYNTQKLRKEIQDDIPFMGHV